MPSRIPPLRMSSGGGGCGIACDGLVSLVQGGGGFRPLYRGCFLGSLVTHNVGHSSACKDLGRGRQTNAERIPQRSVGQVVVRLTMRVSQTNV